MKVDRVKPGEGIESAYLWHIVKGLGVTVGHTVRQLVGSQPVQTKEYPEVRKEMPEGYRGKHRLLQKESGDPKCTACMMCATVCPAACIHIEAGEHPDPKVEKFPVSFDIDLLKCPFCGMCVEACPVDAIRMDSGVYTFADFQRDDFVVHKDELLRTPSQWSDPV